MAELSSAVLAEEEALLPWSPNAPERFRLHGPQLGVWENEYSDLPAAGMPQRRTAPDIIAGKGIAAHFQRVHGPQVIIIQIVAGKLPCTPLDGQYFLPAEQPPVKVLPKGHWADGWHGRYRRISQAQAGGLAALGQGFQHHRCAANAPLCGAGSGVVDHHGGGAFAGILQLLPGQRVGGRCTVRGSGAG